jgi:CRP-like cAMP-binding protein
MITPLQDIPGGKVRSLMAGEFLFHQGDTVESMFLLLEGEVHLIRHQTDGSHITLQRARVGAVLAEASLFSGCYHCDAVASKVVRLLVFSKSIVLARLQTDTAFAQGWLAYLAHEVQQARFRSEVLSLKTVAAKLDAWLNWQGEGLPAKGEWKGLAGQLGVSPEALYRELARRGGRYK